jgi:acetoin utilization deacetylase AcuC-like enzyme
MLRIIIERDSMNKHKPWFDHPENPERIIRVINGLEKHDLTKYVEFLETLKYDAEEVLGVLRRIHGRGYIDFVIRRSKIAPCELDPDTYLSRDSLDLAFETIYLSYITGKNLSGNDIVVLIIRPPGHHAGRYGKAFNAPTLGFCIFNNAAASVMGLFDRGYERIAILDIDAHHGNGTQEIFYDDRRVFHVDIHRDPSGFYPFTGFPDDIGVGKGRGYSANFIVSGMTGDDSYIDVFREASKLVTIYDPEALIVSAGFDGYLNDGLVDLRLTSYTYNRIGLWIRKLGKPTIIMLEGGYSVGLTEGLPALIKGVLGEKTMTEPTSTHDYYRSRNKSIAKYVYNLILSAWRNIG